MFRAIDIRQVTCTTKSAGIALLRTLYAINPAIVCASDVHLGPDLLGESRSLLTIAGVVILSPRMREFKSDCHAQPCLIDVHGQVRC